MTKYTEPTFESYSDTCRRLFPELFDTENKILTLTFQVTEDCCMACSYCYQHNKSKNKMSFNTAKQIIDNLLSNDECYNTSNTNGIIIEFIGGEPLMEIDLIVQIADYFVLQCLEKKHRFLNHFMFSMASNGLLYFEDKVQNFMKKYKDHISYTVSIDGNKELHDACRVDLDGNGTYDRALAAEMHYCKYYNHSLETKMTLSPFNISHTYNAVINLIELGYESISLNCIFEEGWEIEHAKILYQEMKKIADWLFEHDAFRKYRISLYDQSIGSPLSNENTNNWCGGVCNGMLAFDYKGKAYPCIRYMESSLNEKQIPYSIGDLNGLFKTDIEKARLELMNSITRQSQSTEECLNCPIASGCAWCSGYNYEQFGTPNKRATYICWMHKARSLANAYYYNKGYNLLNEKTRFIIHLPEEEALQIISKKEWEMLKHYENQ